MSSRTDSPRGSSVRRREPEPTSAEDALSDPAPPTDDTPTIISRSPAPTAADLDSGRGIKGRRLAHFELIEPIGVGGMAAVIRARDTQLDRFVALKILPPDMAADPENIRRFHQEARSAAKLDHENIARVFYCGDDQRLHFIAFEFVEGDNLRTVIERRGRLPVGEALHYMIQVAAGLAHASQRGVVHRDIKPSNIIITPTGRAKLVDMGLARSLSPRGADDLTQSGVTLGTFDYISPEQALEPRDADARSDIYSLGCTFYHALTGRPPVPDGTAAKKLHHHQHVKPVDPRDLAPSLPLEVVQVLDRMIAKKPSDRFASPELLVQALLTAARHAGTGANVPEGMMSVETPLPPRPTGRPLLWMALGLGLVIGLVLLLDPTSSNTPTPRTSRKPGPAPVPVVAGPKDSPAARADEDKGDKKRALEHKVIEVRAETTQAELEKELAACRDVDHVEVVWLHGLKLSPRPGDAGRSRSAPLLLVQAKQKVTIRAGPGAGRPTIRLDYEGSDVEGLAALTIRAPESDVSGLRFVVDAARSEVPLRGLHLIGSGQHTVRGCVFVQVSRGPNLASLQADAERGKSAAVTLRECVFLGYARGRGEEFAGADAGGQDAVACTGQVKLRADNCAIGPHTTAFRADGEAQIDVVQSTVLLPARPSAAFDTAGGVVTANRCLVARLPGDTEAGAVLVRQQGGGRVFEGSDNAYHDLDGYLAHGDDWQSAGWGAFRKAPGGLKESRRVLSSPWQHTAERLVADLDRQQPESAFRLALNEPAVRSTSAMEPRLVGVENVLGTPWLAGELPLITAEQPRRVLTVEPDTEDADNGVYKSLELAVANVKPGDRVVIRHGGRLDVEAAIRLDNKKLADLKIGAARKFRPELVFRAVNETDSALFRVFDYNLTLEGLDVTLHPAEGEEEARPASHALAALVGDGECVLKGCRVTLVRSDVPVALATLGDAIKVTRVPGMPSSRRERGPLLKLENSVVRGEGDLLLGRASRPMKLDLSNTLVALGGSVLRLEHAGGGDGAMPAAAHKVTVELKQVTAYVGGPVLRLKAEKDPAGMVPVEVRAVSSLFLPANGAKSLIALEGPEGEKDRLGEKWSWTGSKNNAYGKYTSMVAQEGGPEMAGMVGSESWKTKTGDDAATFNVVLTKVPEKGFQAIVPADLVGPAGVGAKLP